MRLQYLLFNALALQKFSESICFVERGKEKMKINYLREKDDEDRETLAHFAVKMLRGRAVNRFIVCK